MPHDHPNVESALIRDLIAPGNAFALAFLFLIFQYSFKLDFQCPCDAFDSKLFCILYAVLPFCGLWLTLTLTSTSCKLMCAQCSTCSPHCSLGCCGRITSSRIVRNAILAGLWIVTILIDGDAAVCWNLTNGNVTHLHDQIPCKKTENLTSDELQNIRRYQALSQVIGLIILFITPLLWFLLSIIYQICKTPYKSLFEDAYEEEGIRCVEMEIREMIKKKTALDCKDTLNKIKNSNVDWKEVSKELTALITKENPLQNLPQPKQALHQANKALHQANQAFHHANQALYLAKEALHLAKQDINQENKALDQAIQALDQANKDIHQANQDVHQAILEIQQANQDIHQAELEFQQVNLDIRLAKMDVRQANKALRQTNQAINEANQALNEANQAINEANQALNEANQPPPQPNQAPSSAESGSSSARLDSTSVQPVSSIEKLGSISAQLESTTAKPGFSSAKQESSSIRPESSSE